MPGITVLPPNPMAPPTTGQGIGAALGAFASAIPGGIQAALQHRLQKEQLALEAGRNRLQKEQLALEAGRNKSYEDYFRGQNERWVEQNRLSAEEAERQEVETGLEYLAAGSKTLRSASPEFQAKAKKHHPEIDLDFDLNRIQKESDQIKFGKYLEELAINKPELFKQLGYGQQVPPLGPTDIPREANLAATAVDQTLKEVGPFDPITMTREEYTRLFVATLDRNRGMYGLPPLKMPEVPAPVPLPPKGGGIGFDLGGAARRAGQTIGRQGILPALTDETARQLAGVTKGVGRGAVETSETLADLVNQLLQPGGMDWIFGSGDNQP